MGRVVHPIWGCAAGVTPALLLPPLITQSVSPKPHPGQGEPQHSLPPGLSFASLSVGNLLWLGHRMCYLWKFIIERCQRAARCVGTQHPPGYVRAPRAPSLRQQEDAGGDGRHGCASAPSVVIAFSSPGYFCLQSQSIKQVRGFLFFHSKYFLHPVSSLFTRRTGARSSKEAHGAVSSFLLTTGLVPAPTPAPAPALDPTPAPAPTPAPRSPSWPRAIPAPSNTPQPQGQVWLEARGQHRTCTYVHTHTHENPARAKTKKKTTP